MTNIIQIVQDWQAVRETKVKLLQLCRQTIDRDPGKTLTISGTDFEKKQTIDKETRWKAEIALKAAEALCNEHREYSIVRFGDGISIVRSRDAENIDPFFKAKNLQGGTLEFGGSVSTAKDLEALSMIPKK